MEDVAKEKGTPSKSARERAGDDSGPEERVVDDGSTVKLPDDSEGLLLAHKSLGLDMRSELQGRYINNPFFSTILKKPKEFLIFDCSEQLVYLKENDR